MQPRGVGSGTTRWHAEIAELFKRRSIGWLTDRSYRKEIANQARNHSGQQIFTGGELVIEGRFRDANPRSQFIHRQCGKPAFGNELLRRGEDLVAQHLAAAFTERCAHKRLYQPANDIVVNRHYTTN